MERKPAQNPWWSFLTVCLNIITFCCPKKQGKKIIRVLKSYYRDTGFL
jgi:hypothetical protein